MDVSVVFLRWLLAAAAVYACMYLGVTLFGLIALMPTPVHWWKHWPELVIAGHELLAYLPCSLLGGWLLVRVFPNARLTSYMSCAAAAVIAMLIPALVHGTSSALIFPWLLELIFGVVTPVTARYLSRPVARG